MEYWIKDLSFLKFTGKGENINIYYDALVEKGGLLYCGDNVTVTSRATILTHESLSSNHDGVVCYGKVFLEDFSCMSYGSFIGPGVVLGLGSILGAHSMIAKETVVPPMEIWGGVPARKVGSVYDLLRKKRARAKAILGAWDPKRECQDFTPGQVGFFWGGHRIFDKLNEALLARGLDLIEAVG